MTMSAFAAAAQFAALLLASSSSSCPFVHGVDLIGSKHVVGYYASWQWYDRNKLASPPSLDYSKVTRVNFAFFQTSVDGEVYGTDDWADPVVLYGEVDYSRGSPPGTGGCVGGTGDEDGDCKCHRTGPGDASSCAYHVETSGLIHNVHAAGREIYPSIGGWTLSQNFPQMAANEESRLNFAANCRSLIVEYDFDGIDIDWEYPGYADHGGTPADTENFNLLLRDVRAELDALGEENGRTYGLTAALPCGPSNVLNVDVMEVSRYLSELNLMTYDFHGSWDATVGVNSPLYDSSSDPESGWSVDGCARNWISRGAPKEKLNIGLAFYGRSFADATALGASHGGADDGAGRWTDDEGSPQYFNIIDKIDEMTVEWDDETKTPIAYFAGGGIVSYDDERSICLKTEYAIDEGLNGFIIWELSGDVMEDLSTPLLDSVNRKLIETGTDCAQASMVAEDTIVEVVGVTTAEGVTTQGVATQSVATQETSVIATQNGISEAILAAADTSPAVTTTAVTTTEYGSTTEEISTPTSALTTAGGSNSSSPWEESMMNWATGATESDEKPLWQSQNQLTLHYDGRKKIKRNHDKPDKPYRPPKEADLA